MEFFITIQTAEVAQPICIALVGQPGQSEHQQRNTDQVNKSPNQTSSHQIKWTVNLELADDHFNLPQ